MNPLEKLMPKRSAVTTNPVNLKKVDQFMRPIFDWFVENYSFRIEPEMEDVFEANPRLIHIMNHGPMFGPWPVGALLARLADEAGFGHRVPFAVAHRLFFVIPGLRDLMAQYLNARQPYTFSEVMANFEAGHFTDFMVLPEGDNCNFGNMDRMREFRSHRYLELAIRLKTNILVTVHRGTEQWSTGVRLDDFTMKAMHTLLPLLYHRIERHRIVVLPSIPAPIPQLDVYSRLYTPKLQLADLADDPVIRQRQIQAESREIQRLMNNMLRELDATVGESPLIPTVETA